MDTRYRTGTAMAMIRRQITYSGEMDLMIPNQDTLERQGEHQYSRIRENVIRINETVHNKLRIRLRFRIWHFSSGYNTDTF
jgi:hypothetical protein